jgi:hypothetical protein
LKNLRSRVLSRTIYRRSGAGKIFEAELAKQKGGVAIQGVKYTGNEYGDGEMSENLGNRTINRGERGRDLSTQDPLGVTTIGARRGTETRLTLGVLRCQEIYGKEQKTDRQAVLT